MNNSSPVLYRAALYCTFGSAVAALYSIAACQILLTLAFASLLMSGTKLRLPPVWLPLGLFMAGTLLSLALSGDPSAGRPQVRKFFVFLMLLAVFSTFRHMTDARRLVLWWAGAGGLAAGWGLLQFIRKLEAARRPNEGFYDYYVSERISGPMSHWMTYSGVLMIVLIMLGAFLLFSPRARKLYLWLGLLAAGVISLALLLGFTRSIWLACCGAALYLLWFWNRRLLLAVPVLLGLLLWLGPSSVRIRAVSVLRPQKEIDSNQHRIVCWRTGWEMIKAHPWFGLGPELVKRDFLKYVPQDIPRPLPVGWYGHLHSIYVHYAAERGIPVLLILMWLLAKIAWDFLRAVRKLPPGPSDEKFVLHGAIAVVGGILISGVFELNLGDSEVLTMFLAVVACGYLAAETVVTRQPAAEDERKTSAAGIANGGAA